MKEKQGNVGASWGRIRDILSEYEISLKIALP